MKYFFLLLMVLHSFSALIARDKQIRFFWDNDVFINGSDQYYTNGFRVEFLSKEEFSFPRLNPFSVLPFLPLEYCQKATGLGFGQNQYTPNEIERVYSRKGDRPYAAWSYLGIIQSLECQKEIYYSEISLGLLGENAGGKVLQSLVHDQIGSLIPLGWSGQVPNSPTLQSKLAYQKAYNPYLGLQYFVNLGNVNVSAGLGPYLRFGKISTLHLPGNNIFQSMSGPKSPEKNEYYFFVNPVVWYQAYDGTLQGGGLKPYQSTFFQTSEDAKNLFFFRSGNPDADRNILLERDWNRNDGFITRFFYFYNTYKDSLPNQLGLNLILFNSLWNGNPSFDINTKKTLLFLLHSDDIQSFNEDSKALVLFTFLNNEKGNKSDEVHFFALKFFWENIVKDKYLSFAEFLYLTKHEKQGFQPKEPRNYQGKINLGFSLNLVSGFYLQISGTVSSPDFYPEKSLPQLHKYGSIQIAYNY